MSEADLAVRTDRKEKYGGEKKYPPFVSIKGLDLAFYYWGKQLTFVETMSLCQDRQKNISDVQQVTRQMTLIADMLNVDL